MIKDVATRIAALKRDHWVYTHPQRPFPLTIDPRNPLLPAYVSKTISAIEEVIGDGS
jgi:hypothetical protein